MLLSNKWKPLFTQVKMYWINLDDYIKLGFSCVILQRLQQLFSLMFSLDCFQSDERYVKKIL